MPTPGLVLALLAAAELGVASSAAPAPATSAAPSAPSPPPGPAGEAAFVTARRAADAAFSGRDDPARLAEAIARYREASALRPGDTDVLLALARAEAFRAQAVPEEAGAAWHEVAQAAERALRLRVPGFAASIDGGADLRPAVRRVETPGAEPLYWLALATMGRAQARGMSAVLAVKGAARTMMARVVELDERIDFGGPRRALGTWLATIPSAAGGGAGAARIQLERARALFPRYQLTRVREAATLAVLLQDRTRFETLLGEVIAFDDATAPQVAPENRLAKRLARELMARRDRLF